MHLRPDNVTQDTMLVYAEEEHESRIDERVPMQGYLTCKKTHPPRTLLEAYA